MALMRSLAASICSEDGVYRCQQYKLWWVYSRTWLSHCSWSLSKEEASQSSSWLELREGLSNQENNYGNDVLLFTNTYDEVEVGPTT